MSPREPFWGYVDLALMIGILAAGMVVLIGIARPWALLALLAVPLGLTPVRTVLSGGRGRELIAALQGTGVLTLATGVLLGAGLALSAQA